MNIEEMQIIYLSKICYCFIGTLILNHIKLKVNYISDEMEHIYVKKYVTYKRL